MLVDLIFFADGKQLYCGRHHAEKLKPRCSNCDEIIFCEECTEAEGLFWHTHHFVCTTCNCALGGQRYIMRDQKPYCTHCFEADYAVKCTGCSGMIGLHVGQVEYGGQSWHADPKCFKCEFCHDPLLNRSFLPKFGYVYCSHKCAVRFEQQNHNNQGHGGESFNHKFAPTQLALPPNSSCEMHRQGIHHSGPGPGPGTGRIKAASANQPTQHSFYNKTFDSNTLNQPSNVNNNNNHNQNHNQNAQLTNQTSNSHIDPLYESINLGRDLNILTLPDDPSKPLSARPISPAQTAISRKQSDPEKERISGNLPPVPPKRTNSQLSSHSSVNFPAAPNMGNTRQDSGIEGGVRENKSVSVNLTGSLRWFLGQNSLVTYFEVKYAITPTQFPKKPSPSRQIRQLLPIPHPLRHKFNQRWHHNYRQPISHH